MIFPLKYQKYVFQLLKSITRILRKNLRNMILIWGNWITVSDALCVVMNWARVAYTCRNTYAYKYELRKWCCVLCWQLCCVCRDQDRIGCYRMSNIRGRCEVRPCHMGDGVTGSAGSGQVASGPKLGSKISHWVRPFQGRRIPANVDKPSFGGRRIMAEKESVMVI